MSSAERRGDAKTQTDFRGLREDSKSAQGKMNVKKPVRCSVIPVGIFNIEDSYGNDNSIFAGQVK